MIADEPVQPDKPEVFPVETIQQLKERIQKSFERLPVEEKLPAWLEQLVGYDPDRPKFLEWVKAPTYNDRKSRNAFMIKCVELSLSVARDELWEFEFWPLIEAYVAEALAHIRRGSSEASVLDPAMMRARTAYEGVRRGREWLASKLGALVANIAEAAESVMLGEAGAVCPVASVKDLAEAIADRAGRLQKLRTTPVGVMQKALFSYYLATEDNRTEPTRDNIMLRPCREAVESMREGLRAALVLAVMPPPEA